MGKFAGSKVTLRPARVFGGDYTLQLFSVKVDTSSGGFPEVVVQWKIVGSTKGYNNARVFEHLICAEKAQGASDEAQSAYEVTINKVHAMGLDVNKVDGNSAKQAAASVCELFTPALCVNARCYEDLSRGDSQYRVRTYLGLTK